MFYSKSPEMFSKQFLILAKESFLKFIFEPKEKQISSISYKILLFGFVRSILYGCNHRYKISSLDKGEEATDKSKEGMNLHYFIWD